MFVHGDLCFASADQFQNDRHRHFRRPRPDACQQARLLLVLRIHDPLTPSARVLIIELIPRALWDASGRGLEFSGCERS